MPRLWKAPDRHSSKPQAKPGIGPQTEQHTLGKTSIGASARPRARSEARDQPAASRGAPAGGFLHDWVPTPLSWCKSCRNSHASARPARTGKAGPALAPAPRRCQRLQKSAEFSGCYSSVVSFIWLELALSPEAKTTLAYRPCAGSVLRADTFPSCSKMSGLSHT